MLDLFDLLNYVKHIDRKLLDYLDCFWGTQELEMVHSVHKG